MRERSFAPTVVLGLAGSALAAVAGAKDWASATGDAAGVPVQATVAGSEAAPLVVALALVSLAAWGVLLVMRRRLRVAAAALGGLAALGAFVSAVTSAGTARDDAAASAVAKGASAASAAHLTGWYYLALVATAVAAAALCVAAVRGSRWPAMGSRYDAPGAEADGPDQPGRAGEASDLEMWKALDEGDDPTA
ncbi:MAG TPA: Trp biosynthesis-associated membrane protein [Nocardioidaceae bacterium]|nr:Trp biosynthesis-associated membrane protein [Nocardioidaceae bacterium]